MRKLTIDQARQEVIILDVVGNTLQEKLRESYATLRQKVGDQVALGEDAEIAANMHNIRVSLNEAFEEVARRGYGRVVFLQEEDEDGNPIREEIFRLSQANATFPENPVRIIARNNPIGSQIASCRVGDDFDVRTPKGERHFVVKALIDLEGTTPLLRPRPEVRLARFYVVEDVTVDTVRNLRAFVEALPRPEETAAAVLPEALREFEKPVVDEFWPTDWSTVILGNEENAALGAQFFTRTTRQQEEAIRAVRGVTVVHGIAGTGKTSVALGRLKFFANFRTGENLREYNLNPSDWVDFNPSDMVGFVLSPSLVQYLKQTAEDLELRAMRIIDFEEFRNQERQTRRLFGRLFKRSADENAAIQRSLSWLLALDAVATQYLANSIEAVFGEPLPKPDTSDGKSVSDSRWAELEKQLWAGGPLRARAVGLIRRLRSQKVGAGVSFGLQGIARSIDADVRLSDRETASLSPSERRTIREAVLNVSLRLFRLLNPSDVYVIASDNLLSGNMLAQSFSGLTEVASRALEKTLERLEQRLVTEDDVVTALCLNAISCDGFERDIADIPYVRSFADKIAVFIDEYQDFNEQQLLLMTNCARSKYRQITVAGDQSQRLHQTGVSNLTRAFVQASEIREISLTENFRQTEPLARFSRRIRAFTESQSVGSDEKPCRISLYVFDDDKTFAALAAAKVSDLPEAATVAVIAPTTVEARVWFDLMAPNLQSAFRNPILSDRARLTERFRTHFTTPLEAKGLEFDAVVIPNISSFDPLDVLAINGLYVAVSRPRRGLLVGCPGAGAGHEITKKLLARGDLVAA